MDVIEKCFKMNNFFFFALKILIYRLLASCSVRPCLLLRAFLMVSSTPLPALPAPATRIVCSCVMRRGNTVQCCSTWCFRSLGCSPFTFIAPYSPARTVAAVPWEHKLGFKAVQTVWLY